MPQTLEAETSITINVTPTKVWEALTTPALVKKYLMGTDVSSDWKEGICISYKGEKLELFVKTTSIKIRRCSLVHNLT